MQHILFVGASPRNSNAVSGIIESFLKVPNEDHKIYFFDLADRKEKITINGKKITRYKNPLQSKHINFYRIKRKIGSILNLDVSLFLSKKVYRDLKKEYKKNKFDRIYAIAGSYFYVEASYLYAKRTNTDFYIISFDPYANNPFAGKFRERRELKEKRWAVQAKKIYIDAEGGNIFSLVNTPGKKNIFNIPIKTIDCLNMPKNNRLIYGGTFYKNIRPIESLYELAEQKDITKFLIDCYCGAKELSVKNIIFHPFTKKDVYIEKLKDAIGVVVLGNINTEANYKPSKCLEAIAFKKIIITNNIKINKDPILSRYPYCFDCHDLDLKQKINMKTAKEALNFDISKNFPDRSEKKFIEEIIK